MKGYVILIYLNFRQPSRRTLRAAKKGGVREESSVHMAIPAAHPARRRHTSPTAAHRALSRATGGLMLPANPNPRGGTPANPAPRLFPTARQPRRAHIQLSAVCIPRPQLDRPLAAAYRPPAFRSTVLPTQPDRSFDKPPVFFSTARQTAPLRSQSPPPTAEETVAILARFSTLKYQICTTLG